MEEVRIPGVSALTMTSIKFRMERIVRTAIQHLTLLKGSQTCSYKAANKLWQFNCIKLHFSPSSNELPWPEQDIKFKNKYVFRYYPLYSSFRK
jgi:hypothetical protein